MPVPLIALAALSLGQTFEAAPAAVRQGETVRVRSTTAAAARMNGRTVRLFPQPEGSRLGLMPVPADQSPGDYTIEFLGDEGAILHTAALTVRDARFPVQNVVLSQAVKELQLSPGEMETMLAFRNTISQARHWDEPFQAPVSGCMISPFGVKRLHNGRPTGGYHGGVDQRSPAGGPIRAVAGGVVRVVRAFNIHGDTVGIDHGQGLTSAYLHLSKFAAKEGAVVHKGDVIGYVGSTGRSTGPHLHWGLYVNGVPVNPLQWVALKRCGAAKTRRRRSPAPFGRGSAGPPAMPD